MGTSCEKPAKGKRRNAPAKNNAIKDHTEMTERIKLLIMICAVCILLDLSGIGCPIRFFTGISCPGCGMTRAIKSALLLDFKKAFYYHPLFLLSPVMVLLFLFEDKINTRLFKSAWIIITALFFITYLIRLFTGSKVISIDLLSHLT